MKQVGIVFRYTFMDAVKKKPFLISTIIVLLLIFLLCLAPRVFSAFSGDDKDKTAAQPGLETEETADSEDAEQICYYIDEAGLLPDGLETLQTVFPEIAFQAGKEAKIDAYRAEIEENGDISVLWVKEENNAPYIKVYCKDFMSGIPTQNVIDTLSKSNTIRQLAGQGVPAETAAQALQTLPYEEEAVGDLDMTGYMLGIVLTMLMFFAIYYYGYGVAMSVAAEKTSRVMETLVVSAKPSRILVGKCLAMGVLGLVQFAGILLFAVVCGKLLLPADFVLGGVSVNLSSITPYTAAFLLAYFVFGYTLFAMLNAVCGASVSKIEDVNSALMPVNLLAIIGFYLGYFTTIGSSSNGILQKIAMYLPFSSPFMVPSRLLNGGVHTSQMLISLAILLVTIVLLTMLSIRVYSANVLHYGKRRKFTEMLRQKS